MTTTTIDAGIIDAVAYRNATAVTEDERYAAIWYESGARLAVGDENGEFTKAVKKREAYWKLRGMSEVVELMRQAGIAWS